MKQLLQILFSSMLLLIGGAVSAEEISVNTKDPYAMVESVANKTFARFHQDIATIQANPDHLKVIVSDELMPYIDYKYAS